MLVNKLIRLTFGFKTCSKLLLQELILLHMFSKFLVVLQKRRKKESRKTPMQLAKLKPKPRPQPNNKPLPKVRKPKESVELKKRRNANAKLKKRSNNV